MQDYSSTTPATTRAARSGAHGLGLFSVGLGLAELLLPRLFTRTLGIEGRETLVRLVGLRELATGLGLLSAGGADAAPWLWARVGGDVLDLGTLAAHAGPDNRQQDNVHIALASVAALTAVDVACAAALSEPGRESRAYGNLATGRSAGPRDYSGRSGLPKPPDEMRGAAADAQVPADLRTPQALRPKSGVVSA